MCVRYPLLLVFSVVRNRKLVNLPTAPYAHSTEVPDFKRRISGEIPRRQGGGERAPYGLLDEYK
jgi:hypothetical protein